MLPRRICGPESWPRACLSSENLSPISLIENRGPPFGWESQRNTVILAPGIPGQQKRDRGSHCAFAIIIVIMSLEAARRLSIPELFHVLGEKLDKEYFTLREIPPPFVFSETSLGPEVCSRPST